MKVIKADGTKETFNPKKLRASLRRAGATKKVIDNIAQVIETRLREGMSTKEIYEYAFDLLKETGHRPVAARYSLKRAVMDLGPSGFPFESLIARVLEERGYKDVETNVEMMGRCVQHEVDIIATTDESFIIVEAKFHNKMGVKTDVKTTLYVDARSMDLAETNFDNRKPENLKGESWLITNTKFTRRATAYAKCVGLKAVGWDYPEKGNFQELIEVTGLHPLTCLTTLSRKEKRMLFEKDMVLCRSLKENKDALKSIGLSDTRIEEVFDEMEVLCTPGALSS